MTVAAMYDEEYTPIESCPHPKQKIFVDLGMKLDKGDVLRVKSE